ncbi:aminoacyl--tRNA ligase-related protein [Streptomyces purpureus]|uniref:Amino acid--[acyl-carrier-protein] ligase 1 n=1 Tax=Streptomyces purpureus TaxID=1951 RepID=A0A918LML2_9ACTN|nr:aminoacyl--tRNA ligase-related protein [Streptomyces purpureus]GGT19448.1 amino acid--[acyl-carrier-protein] ligase 1 [Streptomyces purpureus]
MPTFVAPGIAVLESEEAALFDALEARFQEIAIALGGRAVAGPALLPVEDLARLDFFRNFPHLGLPVATLSDEARGELARGEAALPAPEHTLVSTGCCLPTATCYGLLLTLRDRGLDTPEVITSIGRCFRNEEHYDGLRRLRAFHMREVLYVGSRDGVVDHLARSTELVLGLAGRLGIKVRQEPATDPFYAGDGARSLFNELDPVKFEFVSDDGTAIASVNRHRNFFGERLGIRFGDESAYSGCLAFGVERWVHALLQAHGDPQRALGAIHELVA